jgi:thiamine-phosphate pyrophosphorylase
MPTSPPLLPSDRPRLHGLYAITDAGLIPDRHLVEWVDAAIAGGATAIQYRDKSADTPRRRRQALTLNGLCRARGTVLIVNDDVDLAAEIGAAGVHLGRDDPSVEQARNRLGSAALIGVSCYDRLDLALDAARQGADYVAFGSFFPSPTKPTAVGADPRLLRNARQALQLPIVAIGGITPANGRALVRAVADCLAVVSGVFGEPNIRAAAQAYAALFANRQYA